MQVYLVGGAVRDKLLGLAVKEKDYVVVGAKPEELLRLGYKQVGKEFPVFLHPKTNEEYALARMERKVAPGYAGFTFDTSPDVTLEEDLLRRDLTINAMAETPEGKIIDPYKGRDDLNHKILRHVSPAFAEDPVRILRIARFAARYADLGFHVALETNALMKEMVDSGEIDALVPERVWKEWERALGEKSPVIFFQVLGACGALKKLFPQIHMNGPGIGALKQSVKLSDDPLVRFAVLLHAHDKTDIIYLCNHYRLPIDYKELALLVSKYYLPASQFSTLTAEQMLDLFTQADAFRRQDRFQKFLLAGVIIGKYQNVVFPRAKIEEALRSLEKINVKDWLTPDMKGPEIAEMLKGKRLQALKEWVKENKSS